MASGGTSFWKVFFAILAALVLAGGCIVGGCLFLVGGTAFNMSKAKQEQDAYRLKLAANITEYEISGTGNYSHIRGSVRNGGDRTVSYWRMKLVFRGTDGTVIDTDWTNSTNKLRPGETETFEKTHRHDPRLKNVTPEIEEVRLESTPR